METAFPIIETKLIPPIIKKSVIRRPSLMKKMRQITHYPLTIVHSGAGYGKSTALSLFMNDSKMDYSWYTISANDDDVIPFITYIVHSIRKRYQNFGLEILEYINNMNRYIRDTEITMLHGLFLKELGNLSEEMTIILDDFHLVDHSFSINQWLEKVVEHLPSHIHIILSSRTKPKWNTITKWKVSGHLLEIQKTDLTLSLEDTETLLEDFYGVFLQPDEITPLFLLTEGWVIAVSLIAEQIKNGATAKSILSYQHSSMDDLFHYLAMEVFSKQSPMIQSFIEQVSALEEITPALCNEILGIPGSELLLEQLVEQNAFMTKLSGSNQYRFHALFKASVERKFKEEQYQAYFSINKNIARYYEYRESWELSITHYEKLGLFEEIAILLERAAEEMLQGKKVEQLSDLFKKLPNNTKDQHLSLWYFEGEVQRYLAYYEKAKKCYLHLIDLAEISREQHLMGKAYEGLAKIYLDTIQPGIAERYLYQAIEMMEQAVGKNHEDTQILYGMMAENLINSGQAKKAEKWFNKLTVAKEAMTHHNLDSRMYLRTGKLEDAKKLLLMRYEDSDRSLPQTHRETEILLAYIEACLGNGAEAKQFAQKGIEQGVKNKNLFVEACGWMRLGHAGQLLNDYTPELSEQCYLTALDIMEKIHVPRGKAEPYMGLCILYSRQGEYERALEIGQLALFETEKAHDIWLSTYIRLALGIAAYTCEKYRDALAYFKDCKIHFEQCGDPYGLMLSQLWLSFYYFNHEEWDSFRSSITLAIQEVQLRNYEFIFSKPTPFSPKDLQSFIPILLKAKDVDVNKGFIHSILQNLGVDDIDSHPGYTLNVRTFGQFQVYLGDKFITDKDWQRAKAKELFQFLLIKRNQWWTKEEIYEQMWPEVAEKNRDQEFKVIVNACNKALEPKRKSRSSPFYILRSTNAYRMNPRAVIEIDFEQFDYWVQQGLREKHSEKCIPLLLKGLKLYKGDFLAGNWDVITIESQRNYYKTLFLRGAERLAQSFVQTEQIDEAIYWCEKIIAFDASWEEAYRLLMYCHYQKNNRPLAVKYYQQVEEILQSEFSIEPMETTKQMYEMILDEEVD